MKDMFNNTVSGIREDEKMSFGDKARSDWYFSKLYEKLILIGFAGWTVISLLLISVGKLGWR